MRDVLAFVPLPRSLGASYATARAVSPPAALAVWIAAVGAVAAAAAIAWRLRSGRPRRIARIVVLASSMVGAAAWFFVNGSVEIRPIVRLTSSHGITAGDLAALPFAAAALWAAIGLRSSTARSPRRR